MSVTGGGDRTALERCGSKIRGFLKLNYARVIDLFRRMDTSGDGHLDLDEFKEGLRTLKLNLTDGEFEELFDQFDADMSGTIEIEELDSAIRILRRPQLKYSVEKTVATDGSTFGDCIPEMHGAKMEFLMTLENPSAQYRRDLYGDIGSEYITSEGARVAKAARLEKLRAKRAAENGGADHTLPSFALFGDVGRLRTVSIDTGAHSLFGRTKKRGTESPTDRILRKREKDWILDGNKSVSDKYCSALTEYQSLFDPTMKDFFARQGRRKNVSETFYYEEVTREQRKSMAMAAHQVSTYQNNASMLIFDERFRRVKDAGRVVQYPQKISSATYVDAAHSRGSSGKLDVGLSDRKRPFTPGPFGRLEVKTVVPSPPLSLEDITGDRRYCPAFRRALRRSISDSVENSAGR